MKPAQRAELLKLVAAGHDIEAAAARAGIGIDKVRRASDAFKRQIDDAFRTATAKLRAKLLERALADDDMRAVASILDRREAAQTLASPEITTIRRIICPMTCEHCGKSTIKGAEVVPLTPSGPRLVEPEQPEQPEPTPPEPKRRRLYSGVYVDC